MVSCLAKSVFSISAILSLSFFCLSSCRLIASTFGLKTKRSSQILSILRGQDSLGSDRQLQAVRISVEPASDIQTFALIDRRQVNTQFWQSCLSRAVSQLSIKDTAIAVRGLARSSCIRETMPFGGSCIQRYWTFLVWRVSSRDGTDKLQQVVFFYTFILLILVQFIQEVREVIFPVHEGEVGLIQNFLFGKDNMDLFVAFAVVDLIDYLQAYRLALFYVLLPVTEFGPKFGLNDFIENPLGHYPVKLYIQSQKGITFYTISQ